MTLDDFNQWQVAFTTPGTPATWLNGGFDYNRQITLDDFNMWLPAFQKQLPQL